MSQIDIDEARIYVGTYAKYSGGSLFGKWFELSDYLDKDEFIEVCIELHKDEDDPELMFQDWENIPDELISESYLSDNFFELRDAIETLSTKEQEAFIVWCNNGSHNISKEDAHNLISSFKDEYIGEYNSEEDYAYEVVDDCYDLSEFVKTYFDYEKFTNDLFITDYWFDDGYVFCRR